MQQGFLLWIVIPLGNPMGWSPWGQSQVGTQHQSHPTTKRGRSLIRIAIIIAIEIDLIFFRSGKNHVHHRTEWAPWLRQIYQRQRWIYKRPSPVHTKNSPEFNETIWFFVGSFHIKSEIMKWWCLVWTGQGIISNSPVMCRRSPVNHGISHHTSDSSCSILSRIIAASCWK